MSGAQRSGRCTPKFTHIICVREPSGLPLHSIHPLWFESDKSLSLPWPGPPARRPDALSRIQMLSHNFLLARSDWQVNYGNPRKSFHGAPANLRCKFVLGAADRLIKSVGLIYETIPTRALKRQSKLQITFPSRFAASAEFHKVIKLAAVANNRIRPPDQIFEQNTHLRAAASARC